MISNNLATIENKQIECYATGKNNGELWAIDFAYSKVQTKYVMLVLGNWKFINKGYIE